MLFNINIGFTGLVNKDASDSKGKDVALFVGDTVIVTDSSSPATMLTPSKKKIKNIAIFLKDEESEEEEEDDKVLILTFPAKNSTQKICEIDRSLLCLQQFDNFLLRNACNNRKRISCESAETCLEKLVKRHQMAFRFIIGISEKILKLSIFRKRNVK